MFYQRAFIEKLYHLQQQYIHRFGVYGPGIIQYYIFIIYETHTNCVTKILHATRTLQTRILLITKTAHNITHDEIYTHTTPIRS